MVNFATCLKRMKMLKSMVHPSIRTEINDNTKLMGRLDLGGIPPIPSGISVGKGRIPPMQTLT